MGVQTRRSDVVAAISPVRLVPCVVSGALCHSGEQAQKAWCPVVLLQEDLVAWEKDLNAREAALLQLQGKVKDQFGLMLSVHQELRTR